MIQYNNLYHQRLMEDEIELIQIQSNQSINSHFRKCTIGIMSKHPKIMILATFFPFSKYAFESCALEHRRFTGLQSKSN